MLIVPCQTMPIPRTRLGGLPPYGDPQAAIIAQVNPFSSAKAASRQSSRCGTSLPARSERASVRRWMRIVFLRSYSRSRCLPAFKGTGGSPSSSTYATAKIASTSSCRSTGEPSTISCRLSVRMPAVRPALDVLTDLVLDSQPRSIARN